MTCRVFFTALVVILLTTCPAQEMGTSPEEATPLLIIGVLRIADLSGSLEFSGSCDDIRHVKNFPKLHVPLREGEPPLQALHELFSEDPKMRITQDPDGTVRMVETDVARDLLDLTMGHIAFQRGQGSSAPLYDPEAALSTILGTPEVRDFLASHNIAPPLGEAMNSHPPRSPKSPHISGTLDNVTLSQALDHLLLAFPGLWVYKNCPATDGRKRSFEFSFYRNTPAWGYYRSPPSGPGK